MVKGIWRFGKDIVVEVHNFHENSGILNNHFRSMRTFFFKDFLKLRVEYENFAITKWKILFLKSENAEKHDWFMNKISNSKQNSKSKLLKTDYKNSLNSLKLLHHVLGKRSSFHNESEEKPKIAGGPMFDEEKMTKNLEFLELNKTDKPVKVFRFGSEKLGQFEIRTHDKVDLPIKMVINENENHENEEIEKMGFNGNNKDVSQGLRKEFSFYSDGTVRSSVLNKGVEHTFSMDMLCYVSSIERPVQGLETMLYYEQQKVLIENTGNPLFHNLNLTLIVRKQILIRFYDSI